MVVIVDNHLNFYGAQQPPKSGAAERANVLRCPFHYSWIVSPVDAHKTLISEQSRRASKFPRLRTKSSWQGKFTSAGTIFVWSIFDPFLQNIFLNNARINESRKNWIHLIKYFCVKVTKPSEVPGFVLDFF